MLINEIRAHIRLALSENMQLADKVYFSTGKLSEDDKRFILRLTDGKSSQYTKFFCDVLYYFKQHSWNGGEQAKTIDIAEQVLSYNKNLLPIKDWDIYKSEKNIRNIISALESRGEIIAVLNESPSTLRRNLAGELRVPRDEKEMRNLERLYKYFSDQISGVYNLHPERRDEVLKKLINSKNNTIDKLTDWLDNSDNLMGGEWEDIEKVYDIIDRYPYDAHIVSENDDWIAVMVTDPDLMKELGCNSQWCFSMPLSSQFDQYNYNGIVYWILYKHDFSHQYVLIGPSDDQLYDRGNYPQEGNPYLHLINIGFPDVDALAFEEEEESSLPRQQIRDAREAIRQLNSKNPKVTQLALDLQESWGGAQADTDPLGYVTLYHGGVSLPENGVLEPGQIFFMSPDRDVAQEYADLRGGEVYTIKVKPEDIYWNEGTGEVEFSKGGSIIDMGGFWKIFT